MCRIPSEPELWLYIVFLGYLVIMYEDISSFVKYHKMSLVESFHFLAWCGRVGEYIFWDAPNAETGIITISRVRVAEKQTKAAGRT